ncbi:hypothetical protein GCM10018790_69560 [Kitasatospora xanthocidica]|uniref:hypothetical protein n=1 Tax=Kitasatospora xanthocidica TaxID=83382 RepID=UPI00167A65D7|nr:hypothetical protein [Kitasatospora xanthocidica]GHF81955.1 hypothetical protein GCM10018790_69560 [Kitasatospora xanthocidica]
MNNTSGKLARTAAVLGLTVAALTAVSAAPATAGTSATAGCTKYYKVDNIQVQVDNCSDGWVWIYTGSGTYYTATVRVTDNFGHDRGEQRADAGKAVANKYQQVHSIKICGTKWLGIPHASPWWTDCTNEIYV